MSTKTDEIINRLHVILGVKNDSELCKALDIKAKSTLSSWRARDSAPYAICVDIAQKERVSLDWLLTGKGEMYRQEPGGVQRQSEPDLSAALGVVTPAAILNRMCQVLKINNDAQLSQALQESSENLNKWREQGAVPYEACEKLAEREKISLRWLITGFGDQEGTETMNRRMYIMLQMMEALPDQQQQEILSVVQEKERINTLERQIAALTKK
ncbi:MAG: helix-turn-helix domain-containing protein [Methyloprofundus sp.]|nr:helix-turn-helix domain-containing protein [Methyloprofundus sp.]